VPPEIGRLGKLEKEFRARDAQAAGASIDSEYVHLAWPAARRRSSGISPSDARYVKRELAGALESSIRRRRSHSVRPSSSIRTV